MKAVREKQNFTYREKINSNDSKFLIRGHGGQKEVAQHFLMLKKNCQTVHREFCIQRKCSSGMKEEIKSFSDEEKLREFVVSRPTLKEWLKEYL